jgi:hypothetical protein
MQMALVASPIVENNAIVIINFTQFIGIQLAA